MELHNSPQTKTLKCQIIYAQPLRLDKPELNRACELMNQELGRSWNWAAGNKILNAVAKRLMAHDWQGSLDITTDFIAYATDHEQSDCTKNIKAVVTKDQFATFKKNGWLI